jgi:hypothetical protein
MASWTPSPLGPAASAPGSRLLLVPTGDTSGVELVLAVLLVLAVAVAVLLALGALLRDRLRPGGDGPRCGQPALVTVAIPATRHRARRWLGSSGRMGAPHKELI